MEHPFHQLSRQLPVDNLASLLFNDLMTGLRNDSVLLDIFVVPSFAITLVSTKTARPTDPISCDITATVKVFSSYFAGATAFRLNTGASVVRIAESAMGGELNFAGI